MKLSESFVTRAFQEAVELSVERMEPGFSVAALAQKVRSCLVYSRNSQVNRIVRQTEVDSL